MRKRHAKLGIPAAILMVLLAGGLALSVGQAGVANPQAKNRSTVLAGVFTADQAERGKKSYEGLCSSCHVDESRGTGVPDLESPTFIESWREDSLDNLFNYIRNRMPPRASPR